MTGQYTLTRCRCRFSAGSRPRFSKSRNDYTELLHTSLGLPVTLRTPIMTTRVGLSDVSRVGEGMNFHAHGRRSSSDRDGGAAAVEFAIIGSLLFLLVFGIIAFGVYFAQNLSMSNAARQGARFGVVNGSVDSSGTPVLASCGNITNEVQTASNLFDVKSNTVQVEVDALNPDGTPGGTLCTLSSSTSSTTVPCQTQPLGTSLVVKAQVSTPVLVPLIFTNPVTVTGQGVFRCEFQ